MAVCQAVPQAVASEDPDEATWHRLAPLLAPDETQLFYSLCLQGRAELALAPDEYNGLLMLLLRLLAFKPGHSYGAAGSPPPPKAEGSVARTAQTEPAAQPTPPPLPSRPQRPGPLSRHRLEVRPSPPAPAKAWRPGTSSRLRPTHHWPMRTRHPRPSAKTTARRRPRSIDQSRPTSRTRHLDLQRHRGPQSAPDHRWTCRLRAAIRCRTVGPSSGGNSKPVA